jgi:hypothetical protein
MTKGGRGEDREERKEGGEGERGERVKDRGKRSVEVGKVDLGE